MILTDSIQLPIDPPDNPERCPYCGMAEDIGCECEDEDYQDNED